MCGVAQPVGRAVLGGDLLGPSKPSSGVGAAGFVFVALLLFAL